MWKVRSGEEKSIATPEDLVATLLTLRGLTPDDAEVFFKPSYVRDVHNPYTLGDMQRAVDRVYEAVKHKQRIMVYGDYDADGITSTAIMMDVLRDIGAHAVPYLPHRYDDGYGLNGVVLKQAKDEFDVLITVDCGIGNGAEVAMLQEFGKDVIIVDHHELPEQLPNAHAILHPRHPQAEYAWGHLCGAGTSWKFAQALLRHQDSPHANDPDREKWLLDLAMIGTIADVMPLLGENRAIVSFGKEVLLRTKRPGLQALLKQARVDVAAITAQDIAFRIIPLLNAAGRIGHPQSALNALIAHTPEQAEVAVKELISLNNLRRSMTKKIMDDALLHVDESLPYIFAANKEWHAGIVGLVAGRLASQFGKPAFVLGGLPVEREAAHVVGSARGAGHVNVMQALETVRHHTMKLGGHAGAAGFSVLHESVDDMRQGLNEYFSSADAASQPAHLIADAIIDPRMVSRDTVRALKQFEPFGEQNPEPVFVLRNMQVYGARKIGASQDHLKMHVAVGERDVEAIGFGLAEKIVLADKPIDILAKVGINEFRGKQSLELQLVDILPSSN